MAMMHPGPVVVATAAAAATTITTHEDQLLESFASFLSSAITNNGNGNGGGLSHPHQNQHQNQQNRQASAEQLQYLMAAGEEKCCSVPSLSLKRSTNKSASVSSVPVVASTTDNNKFSLEQAAAQNLARPIQASREELQCLPLTIVRNISESFMSLVDSRVRSYLVALSQRQAANTRTSNSSNNNNNNNNADDRVSQILAVLMAQSSTLIKPTAIVSSFRVYGASDQVAAMAAVANKSRVAPMIQETVIDLNVLGDLLTVTISGNGNIMGIFTDAVNYNSNSFSSTSTATAGMSQLLSQVSISIDTSSFLRSMMAQVRDAVRRAVKVISQLFLPSAACAAALSNNIPPVVRVRGVGGTTSSRTATATATNSDLVRTMSSSSSHNEHNNGYRPTGIPSYSSQNQVQLTRSQQQQQQQDFHDLSKVRRRNSSNTSTNTSTAVDMPPPPRRAPSGTGSLLGISFNQQPLTAATQNEEWRQTINTSNTSTTTMNENENTSTTHNGAKQQKPQQQKPQQPPPQQQQPPPQQQQQQQQPQPQPQPQVVVNGGLALLTRAAVSLKRRGAQHGNTNTGTNTNGTSTNALFIAKGGSPSKKARGVVNVNDDSDCADINTIVASKASKQVYEI
jgi:hypothetical protein